MRAGATKDGTFTYAGKLPQGELHSLVAKAVATISVQSGKVARNRFGVAPLKVAESIMLGVPAIVSDIGGHSDVLRAADYEWIVPPDDPHALAEVVAKISADGVNRDEIASIGRRLLTWESIGEKTADVLGEVFRDRER